VSYRRGVGDPAAILAAEAGIAVFRVAFERWVDPANRRDLRQLIPETLEQMRDATAASGVIAATAHATSPYLARDRAAFPLQQPTDSAGYAASGGRILLDEDVPRPIERDLEGHEVSAVPEVGWADIKNGVLLGLAVAAGSDVSLQAPGLRPLAHLFPIIALGR
jgi:hypothetical protein